MCFYEVVEEFEILGEVIGNRGRRWGLEFIGVVVGDGCK